MSSTGPPLPMTRGIVRPGSFSTGACEGFVRGGVMASYLHLHWAPAALAHGSRRRFAGIAAQAAR